MLQRRNPRSLPSRRRTNLILLAAGALATAGFASAALAPGSGPAAFAITSAAPAAEAATAAPATGTSPAAASSQTAEPTVLAGPRTAPVPQHERWGIEEYALLGAAIAATAATCGVAFGRPRGERSERAQTARIEIPAAARLV